MTPLAQTVATLDRLIAFPTVSTDSNIEMITDIANRLEAIGARCHLQTDEDGGKANLFATLGPDAPGGIMLSGHTDVVPIEGQDWTTDPFKMHHDGTHLIGRGSCDMKGFIAAALTMADTFAQSDLKRPVHFAFTHDEETGCIGAQRLIPELKTLGLKPDMAIIGEPTEMRVIEGHKGCCEYTARFTGLAGHGSDPAVGVNAAEYAVRYVARLMALREDLRARAPAASRFVPPETTVNIGRITGGIAHNVIVEKAEVDWEFRPVQQSDFDFVKSQIEDYVETELLPAMRAIYPGADITTEVMGEVAGLEPMDQNAIRDLIVALTGANGVDVVPFGTEAGLFQQMGMDVVVCGPGSIAQAHKPDEFICTGQLSQCLTLLEKLAKRLV